jgi:uncharacterized membrane protein YoaK (UPF0700 family)
MPLSRGAPALAGALATIAGFVDAIGFTRLFGVFPANQSGNAVLLGIGVGDFEASEIWRPALAVVAFALGVALGIALRRTVPSRHVITSLLGVEAGLLIVLAAVAGELGDVGVPVGGSTEVLMLAIAAGAMGIQTDVVRRAAGVTVSTTYQTGAIDRIAETATDAVLGRRPETRASRGPLAILVLVLVTYVVGAALGAAVAGAWGRALWVPAGAAVGLFSVAFWLSPRAGYVERTSG